MTRRTFLAGTSAIGAAAVLLKPSVAISQRSGETANLASVRTLVPSKTFRGHRQGVSSLQFSKNEQLIYSHGQKTISVWDRESGQLKKSYNSPVQGNLFLDAEKSRLFVASTSGTILIDLKTWKAGSINYWHPEYSRQRQMYSTQNMVISDRLSLYGVCLTNALLLLDRDTLKTIALLRIPGMDLFRTRFSADLGIAAWPQSGGGVAVWDVKAKKRRPDIFGHRGGRLDALQVSPDGTRILTASGHELALWDTTSGRLLRRRTFVDHTNNKKIYPVPLALDARFERVILGGYTLYLYDLRGDKIIARMAGHKDHLGTSGHNCQISPSGRYAASGDGKGHLYAWTIIS